MDMKKLLKKIAKHIDRETGIPHIGKDGRYGWTISLTPNTPAEYVFVIGEDPKRPGLIHISTDPIVENGGTEETASEVTEHLLPMVAKFAPYIVDVDPITVH